MFQVGQKVVCISEPPLKPGVMGIGDEILPEVGSIYTIRAVATQTFFGREFVGVHLSEIRNVPHRYAEGEHEVYFGGDHFRPVVERKTDISIFRRMLTPHDQKVEV